MEWKNTGAAKHSASTRSSRPPAPVTSWGMQGMSVTGAGGLLDRVDALCFAAPVFFHSTRWYFGL